MTGEGKTAGSGVSLDAVAALVERAARVDWFGAVGAPLGAAERADAARYLDALGLAGPAVEGVADWAHAKALAAAPQWDPAWWEAEERLRVALLDAAAARHGRAPLLDALTRAMRVVSEPADERAARAVGADEALARAAAGAASQACYLAALATADGADRDHAFLAKYRLFEAGRWPLGIVDGRFRVF